MIILFFFIAIIFSLFYGFSGWLLWYKQDEKPKLRTIRLIHEIWFNFIGSFIGWLCIFIIYKSLLPFGWEKAVYNITWQHIVLFIIGVLGITGLLPYVLWSISRSIDLLIERVLCVKK